MDNNSGLNKDGGISFSRKPKKRKDLPDGMFSRRPEDKVEEEVEEPKQERNIDVNELAKMERLGAKLSKAKRIQGADLQLMEVRLLVSFFILIVFLLTLILWIL